MNTSDFDSSQPGPSELQIELGAKPARHLGMRWLILLAVSVAVIAGTTVWLSAIPRRGTGTFGPTGATPAYIVVTTPTSVLFTSQIGDRQLKKRSVILLRLDASGQPTAILGRLNDEGRRGDLKAGDGIYSFQTTLNEPSIGKIGFRVAARFKPGTWGEPELDDDDWDTELATLSADRTTKKDRLGRLLRRLDRYTLSNIFYVTVDPFTLPPDPGDAGEQTLQGIDSDNDGVRDDVQRWIALTYSGSQRNQFALRQNAMVLQEALLARDASIAQHIASNELAAARCLAYVTDDYRAITNLTNRILNTDSRRNAYGAYTDLFHGPLESADLSELKSFCDFDPDSLRN